MRRLAILALLCGALCGCAGVPAMAWVGLGAAGLGYAASANNLIGVIVTHEANKPKAP